MTAGAAIPTPYIPHPERLLSTIHPSTPAVCMHLEDPAEPHHRKTLFFAGDAVLHESFFDQQQPEQWLSDYQRLLTRFTPGPLMGYFAYESGFQHEPTRWQSLRTLPGQPMFRFYEVPYWYEADHSSRTGRILTTSIATADDLAAFNRLVETPTLTSSPHQPSPAIDDAALEAMADFTRPEYIRTATAILDQITQGQFYELNFTQRFRKISPMPPAQLFQHLLEQLQPRYAFFARFPDETIVSASPELFLHKSGNRLQTCPIKGSFRAPVPPEEQRKLAAEHVMVVDLARNDFGRISDLQWVHVAEHAIEKTFGAITHLESRVTAHTSQHTAAILAATTPAASITGMPKVIVTTAIDAHEKSARGIYTGHCGVLWPDGDFQLNVAIRTLRAQPLPGDQWHYTGGSGGAITADSDPAAEYQECLAKIRPLLSLL